MKKIRILIADDHVLFHQGLDWRAIVDESGIPYDSRGWHDVSYS
jgi:hypothetical protein